MNVKIAFNLLPDQTSNFTAYMGAIRWGDTGDASPHFFRQWGYNVPGSPHFSL